MINDVLSNNLNFFCHLRGNHGGNLQKHVERYHKDSADILMRDRENLAKPQLQRKRRGEVLNGVKMTGEKLKKLCVRLVTEHGRPFALLDDEAFQEIITPLLEAMPASEKLVLQIQ